MKEIKVKNMSRKKDQYQKESSSGLSWKELYIRCFYEINEIDEEHEKMGFDLEFCHHLDCQNENSEEDLVGAHVKNENGTKYMTLLCKSCNHSENKDYMKVDKDSLILLKDILKMDQKVTSDDTLYF